MSPRTFVTRAAAVFALAAIGLAACESKTIVQPNNNPLTIVVTPANVTLTSVGAQAQIVALVTGGATGTAHTVTWASSNTNVATVDANGMVTAKAAGTTSVVATATADATVKAAAQVLVQLSVPTDTLPPTVSIKSIVENNGDAVDLQDVYDEINVVLNVDVPAGNTITAVNWLVDGQNVCSQTFTGSSSAGGAQIAATAAVEMSCQINTADTTAAGLPKFLNGQHTLSATLVSGTTIKATTSQILIFNNEDNLNFTQDFTSHAVDPDGLAWQGGNMTLTARPIMYSGGTIAKVNFEIYGCMQYEDGYDSHRAGIAAKGPKPGPAASKPTNPVVKSPYYCSWDWMVVVDSVAPFKVTFAADTTIALPAGSEFSGHEQPLEGDLSPQLHGEAWSVTGAGTEGPSAGGPYIKYDNRPPYFTSDAMAPEGGWVGLVNLSNATFEAEAWDEYGVSGPAEESGLSSVIYKVQARDTGSETWTTYASTSAIGNKLFATEEFQVQACDALNNCSESVVEPALGVDIQAPTVQFDVANTVKDGDTFKTNPTTAEYVIGFTDLPTPGGSGFSTTTPLQIIEKADTGGGSVCVTGSGAKCDTPASEDSNVPVDGAGTQQGYVAMSAYVVDQAGNKSNTITRTVLVDYTAPTADSVSVPTAPLAGGAAETFRAVFKDNVVLASSTGQLSYVGAAFVKNVGSVTLGAYGQFVKRATGDFADPFFIAAYRTLGSATWVLPENLAGTVKDVAGNSFAFALAVPDVPDAPTTDPFERVTAATIAVASDSVSLTATLTIGTDSVTVPPNAQVQVYKFASAMHSLVATATAPIITVNTSLHTATFTWTATASSKVGTGQLSAMFVTTNGIALFVPGS